MGCFGFEVPDIEEPESLIVDVNKILSDKAWNNFKFSLGYFGRKCIKRSNYKIEVPDNFYVFEQISQKITNPGRGIKISPSDENETPGGASNNMLNGKVPKQRSSNAETVSLDTTFSNDTAEKQTYQFVFSKERKTTVEVSFQKGFTLGGKASFSIGAPKVLGGGELGLETEMQYSVTKSEGQTFEESMTMEATSSIAVGPKSNYVASVQLDERMVHASFQVRTRMSIPQGRAPVYIRKKKDMSLVYVYHVKSLKDIFGGEQMCVKVQEGDVIAKDKIDFITEGFIKGSLALDHKIILTSDETEEEKVLAKTRRFQASDD